MNSRASLPFIFVVALMALAVCAPAALAQQQGAPQQAPQPVQAAPQGPLDERILRLEQRILDLQTVIGTLQTFVRDGGGVPSQPGFPPAGGEGVIDPAGGPSELSIRMLALETQIKALTTQMEQVASHLDRGGAGAGAPLQQGALPPLGQQQPPGAPPLGGASGTTRSQGPLGALPGGAQFEGVPGFTTSAATPPLQNPFADPGPAPPAQAAQQLPRTQAGLQPPPQPFPPAMAPPAPIPGAGGGPRAVYEASYESFLRSDFQRSGDGFQNFVKTFPDDQLISNAYYWLGRTHYARRQYEPAAKAFLAGFKKDKKNSLAPEALLHLGMSLGAMGEKGAACSTLGAIAKQFPNVPPSLKSDVADVLKRTGC